MARINATDSPLILSSEAAEDLRGLLHALPILGSELNAFVARIREALDRAKILNGEGDEALLQINIYPVKKEI